MKKQRISLRSLILVTAALLLCITLPVKAEATQSKTLSIINYNVAGLPEIISGRNGKLQQPQIGRQISEKGYDIVAVQEDFGYHKYLADNLSCYEYATSHLGGVPVGDGLNLFSKFPLWHENRIPWEQTYGVLNHGSDELTPKGILYSVIELEDGVYLDFYNIHADAFDDEGSRRARESNFRQLADLICANSAKNDRPVIVTGDFNTYSHLTPDGNSNFRKYFFQQAGLKDAWTEVCNDGDYVNYEKWEDLGGSWGKWDSVEMILYKNGGGVEISPTAFSYIDLLDEQGNPLSDHVAATAEFVYEKTDGFVSNGQPMEKGSSIGGVGMFVLYLKNILVDVIKIIFSRFKNLAALAVVSTSFVAFPIWQKRKTVLQIQTA